MMFDAITIRGGLTTPVQYSGKLAIHLCPQITTNILIYLSVYHEVVQFCVVSNEPGGV
jgi:hypothetical protein